MNPKDKEKIYRYLAKVYGYTPNEIAEMNWAQINCLLVEDNIVTFRDITDYMRWKHNA